LNINIISVGHKVPNWVEMAVDDFIKRFPPELKINLIQIPLIKRGKNPDIKRIMRDEGVKILAAIPAKNIQVALDVKGKKVTTEALSQLLKQWIEQSQDVAIVIGGPDGLSDDVLKEATLKLSLSDLTFPHTLVKVMLVEQLYRAWSILKKHPYHRA
jgi:23S rRNA (pseudouridine1915-N3)-methyltransferase